MRAIISCIMICIGTTHMVSAQENIAPAENTFIAKDVTKADAISSASFQTYPVDLNQDRLIASRSERNPVASQSYNTMDGPILDWSNPAGFLDYSSNARFTTEKHEPLSQHKYNYKKRGRCYRF